MTGDDACAKFGFARRGDKADGKCANCGKPITRNVRSLRYIVSRCASAPLCKACNLAVANHGHVNWKREHRCLGA